MVTNPSRKMALACAMTQRGNLFFFQELSTAQERGTVGSAGQIPLQEKEAEGLCQEHVYFMSQPPPCPKVVQMIDLHKTPEISPINACCFVVYRKF
ncbi:hypothetical protein CEXT_46861 [Caerostris extrusa]|uniref:Uncharacterized protein n=1 Tax=Caerostris extrusa TaxID=172846 RepID=A0AAV4RBE5_CAEEX|nr:hypothetical protein CEXT_46861 [Caerostris extrusa]